MISQEIEKVKRKEQELQSFVDGLETKVEKCYDKAEKDHCIESMMKGNSFQNTKTKFQSKSCMSYICYYVTCWFSVLIDYTEALTLLFKYPG